MKIGIPKEIHPGERRVAMTPENVKRLRRMGFEVAIEMGAGASANFFDPAYLEAGAEIAPDAPALWAGADIVIKVQPPEKHPGVGRHEAELLRDGGTLISFVFPAGQKELLERLADRRATVLAVDCIPRITRAQKMDALSSMANIAGYRAVIEAANAFGRFFTGQITAAGKIPPAKVLIIGAGVAGLAAIGAARGMGAIVRAFDVRPAVREEVQSMGAEFLQVELAEDGSGTGGYAREMSPAFIEAEMELFRRQAAEVDIIITTAQIPGKKAPLLLTRKVVEGMPSGSVIVDLAAEQGGNCELTHAGQVVRHNGVTIIGYTDLASRLPGQASQLYGTNLSHLMDELGGGEKYNLDLENEVIRGALVLHNGQLTWPPPKPKQPEMTPQPKPGPAVAGMQKDAAPKRKQSSKWLSSVLLLVAGAILIGIGIGAPDESMLSHLTVFILACFVGWQLIWNVTPALHTPLMSVTNAISGIIIIGGMLQLTGGKLNASIVLGAVAVLLASINVVGGFWVTQRMLQMFRKD